MSQYTADISAAHISEYFALPNDVFVNNVRRNM